MRLNMENKKEIVSFSLDPQNNLFIKNKHWEYKVSKSSFVNIVFSNLKKKEYKELLDGFFKEEESVLDIDFF